MRKITLLLLVVISAWVYADNGSIPKNLLGKERVENRKKLTEILKPEFSLTGKSSLEHTKRMEMLINNSDIKALKNKDTSKITTRKYQSETETIEILDSVIYLNHNGLNESREIFKYDENGNLLYHSQSLWDRNLSEWYDITVFTYEYDENGNMLTVELMMPESGEGMKEEYVYNDKGQYTEAADFFLIDGEWVPNEKGEYTYDKWGNQDSFIVYQYNGTEWVNLNKASGEFDEEGRVLAQESYTWMNGEWYGLEKAIYTFNEYGMYTLYGYYEWQEETSTWLYSHKFEQTFEGEKLILQKESFWNTENEDWNGNIIRFGEYVYNNKTEYAYDEQERILTETAYLLRGESWIKRVVMTYTYTNLEGGETEVYSEVYFVEEDIYSNRLTQRFNALGLMTFNTEAVYNEYNDIWEYIYEDQFTYDEAGYPLSEMFWYFEANVKFAEIASYYTYDANHNVIEYETFLAQGTSDDDWLEYSKFEYEYENNVRTRSYAYQYDVDNGKYVTNWGTGEDCDFDKPFSMLVVPEAYDSDFKVLNRYNYDGTGAAWVTSTFVFYWTEKIIEIGDGINNASENSLLSVYPNPTAGVIYINSPEESVVNIYNPQGIKVFQTVNKEIDLSGFAAGIYIVEINGIKTKVIKK